LTATGIEGDRFGFDVMLESLRRSSLGAIDAGSKVNLELALRADARLGGHIMQGHVDGVGTVAALRDEGFSRIVTIDADAELLRYVVEKGSIAVDGVSLTVSRVDDTSFDVSLIPETLERTNLGATTVGRTINLEVDVVAKYVEKLVGGARA
jgi:riboflavin synthase